MIKKLQKKYALSEQGAKDLIKGCLACVLQNLSFMFPVGLLYYLVSDLMNGGVPGGKIPFYVARLRGVYRPDTADHFLSIQCHLFCHLQRKRHPPHYSGRASAQNPPFFFREKGFSRSYQYHYGGLHLPGAEFFTFYP